MSTEKGNASTWYYTQQNQGVEEQGEETIVGFKQQIMNKIGIAWETHDFRLKPDHKRQKLGEHKWPK